MAQVLPSSKAVEDFTVVPHKPAETRILRNLGYSVPSPILYHYDWRRTSPFEAQRVTAAMLVCEPRAFVLNGMGTGKTRSILFAFDYLRKLGLVKRMLVVAPLSTLSFTWAREVFQVMPEYRVGIVHGSRDRRLKILTDKEIDIFVINHDGVGVVAEQLAAMDDLDILAIDEVSAYRNNSTRRWKIMNKLTSRFSYVWGLTGTPTPKSPTDAFGIIRLINPQAYPSSFKRFRDEMMVQVNQFKWVPRTGSEKKVFDYMQPAVRYTLADCIDIPPTQYSDEQVKIGTKQQKTYDAIVKHGKIMVDEAQITAVNAGVLVNKLLQISAGCVYSSEKVPVVLDAKERLGVVSDLVDQADGKCIIFCPYIPIVDMVHDHLQKQGVKVAKVYGATTPHERANIFSEFQDGPPGMGPKVIVAHPKTMSHGLTLTAANMIIWYAPTDDLEIYEQANARIARPGQTAHRVIVKHIVGTKMEELVYKRLKGKQKAQGALLELFEEE